MFSFHSSNLFCKATKILKERMSKKLIKNIIIVAITAYNSEASEKECLNSGVDKISNFGITSYCLLVFKPIKKQTLQSLFQHYNYTI